MKLRCKLRNIYSVIVEQKKLEGFDLIFTRIPEISLYQILLFIGASYTIIVSGQVQTGSVFLNAKPEQYRCRNKLDSFPDATYQNAHFASGKSNSTIKSKGCSKRRGLPQTVHELGTKNIAQNKDLPKEPIERTIRPKNSDVGLSRPLIHARSLSLRPNHQQFYVHLHIHLGRSYTF